MSQLFMAQRIFIERYAKYLTLLVLAVLIVALVLSVTVVNTPQLMLTEHDDNRSAAPVAEKSNTTEQEQRFDDAMTMQQLLTLKPLTGKLTQRPDFVSPLEWQVLQGVSHQQANSDQELTRLVNNLRFNKQLSGWQSPLTSASATQRQQLAQQLLAEIPVHVALQELSIDDGKKLQQQLVLDVVSDPQQRRQRQEKEAKRLPTLLQVNGVKS